MVLNICNQKKIRFLERVFFMSKVNRVALDTDSIFVRRFKGLIGVTKKLGEVAKELDVSRPTISNWLQGICVPNQAAALRIAEHYNVSVNWLQGISDNPTTDTSVEAICNYTGLSEKSIQKLADLTKYNNGSFKNCLDLFFTNPKFDMLPIALRKYLNTKSAHEDYKQKLISLLKQYNIQVTDIDKQAAQIYYIASTEPNGYDPNVVLCAKAVAELKTELEFSEYMIQQSMVKILSEYNKEGE